MVLILFRFILTFFSSDPCFAKDCIYDAKCEVKRDDTAICKCEDKCPSKVDAVCGSDGVTYPNDCKLKHQQCLEKKPISVAKKGPCSE